MWYKCSKTKTIFFQALFFFEIIYEKGSIIAFTINYTFNWTVDNHMSSVLSVHRSFNLRGKMNRTFEKIDRFQWTRMRNQLDIESWICLFDMIFDFVAHNVNRHLDTRNFCEQYIFVMFKCLIKNCPTKIILHVSFLVEYRTMASYISKIVQMCNNKLRRI